MRESGDFMSEYFVYFLKLKRTPMTCENVSIFYLLLIVSRISFMFLERTGQEFKLANHQLHSVFFFLYTKLKIYDLLFKKKKKTR